jgi:hypothetical protein
MDDDWSRGGWWKTLPGVLTAVGALVTALVGGVIGLKQAGIIFTGAKPQSQGEVGRADRPVALPQRPGPEAPSATAPPSAAAPSSVPTPLVPALPSASPAYDHVQVSDVTYTILSAEIQTYDIERLRLRFEIRITNQGKYGVAVGTGSFRLLADSIPRPPENFFSEALPADAAKEWPVVFVFPRSTHSLVLKIADGVQDALIPVQLKP